MQRYRILALLAALGICLSPAALAGGGGGTAELVRALFDAQPLGPISTGGPGQPINVSSVLTAEVIEQTFETPEGVNRALRLTKDSSGTAGYARFEFLGAVEPASGTLLVEFDLLQLSAARFNIAIRENTTSSADWGRMTFLSNGQIAWADADSPSGVVLSGSSLVPGTPMNVLIAIDLDARLVDVYLDGNLRLAAEPTYAGVEGVGAVLLGIDSPTTGPSMLDNLLVTHLPPVQIYSNGFESP